MDENKVTHVSEDVITRVTNNTIFVVGELIMYPGREHTFIGMDIELIKDGKMKIGMKSYIEETIQKIGKGILIEVASSETSRLFDATEGYERSTEEKALNFQLTVGKYCG